MSSGSTGAPWATIEDVQRICGEMLNEFARVLTGTPADPALDSSLAGAASGETGGASSDQKTRDALCDAELTVERLRASNLRLRAVALAARQFAPIRNDVVLTARERALVTALHDIDSNDDHHGVRVHLDEAKKRGLPTYDGVDSPDSGPAKEAVSSAEEWSRDLRSAQRGTATGALSESHDEAARIASHVPYGVPSAVEDLIAEEIRALVRRREEAAILDARAAFDAALRLARDEEREAAQALVRRERDACMVELLRSIDTLGRDIVLRNLRAVLQSKGLAP